MKRYCKKCRDYVSEENMDVDSHLSVGMYGAIVIADIYHKHPCGGIISKNEIIDNKGNIFVGFHQLRVIN